MESIIIRMPQRVTTDSVSEFAAIIDGLTKGAAPEDKIVFDAGELLYISSSGLREILKVRKAFKDVSVINCSLEAYDTFEVTGFTSMMSIKKKPKSVSSEGLRLIGSGGEGKVWLMEDGLVLKTYAEGITPETVEEEQRLSRYLFSMGFPTSIPFNLVQCGENYGIIYELMADGTLSEGITSGKVTLEEAARIMAGLFCRIHETEDVKHELDRSKDLYHGFIDKDTHLFNEEEISKLHKLVDAIDDRDTVVHGDFHPKNVMKSGDEYYLIDIGEVSSGHPIFEYIATYCDLYLQIVMNPAVASFMGLSADDLKKLWSLLEAQLFDCAGDELKDIESLLEKMGCLQFVHLLSWPVIPPPLQKMASDMVRRYLLSVDVDEVISEFKRLEHYFLK